ncbi:hypothetical protein CEXT_199381 [Caerostris extrusa]|uniref:Uncharacterized protein n=1 Tax=Caerostris extrusa TaxID=172846 RepID=A0AAV4WU89_CAEEX|nr:hypothetical protein CEXT_199381 [Caerostris extrusa]
MSFRQNLFRAVCSIRKTLPGGIERKVGHSPVIASSEYFLSSRGPFVPLYCGHPPSGLLRAARVLGIMTGACASGISTLLLGDGPRNSDN